MGGTIHKAENNDILQRIRSDAAAAAAQLAEAVFGDGHRISLLSSDDDRLAFNSGHIPGVSESQPAAKKKKLKYTD